MNTEKFKESKFLLEHIRKNRGEICRPVRIINVLSVLPLAYRSFGGHAQGDGSITTEKLEHFFNPNYLLTMILQALINKHLLYNDGSCQTLYCDGYVYDFFKNHGLLECCPWHEVDHQTLDNVPVDQIDTRIFYSLGKPYGLLAEADKSVQDGLPILFLDTDLILKKRHDAILPGVEHLDAAYSHQESPQLPCYPDFRTLHLPKGCQLPEDMNYSLPAVNTCMMYFRNHALLRNWCIFFRDLFLKNRIEVPLTPQLISQHLLGIDQRTFPMVADQMGLWGGEKIAPFMNITWKDSHFMDIDSGESVQWHYYTLEHHPEHPEWMQEITHTWINKADIEKDALYQNYQNCLMLDAILLLEPKLKKSLGMFSCLQPYFRLLSDYPSIDAMVEAGVASRTLHKL